MHLNKNQQIVEKNAEKQEEKKDQENYKKLTKILDNSQNLEDYF